MLINRSRRCCLKWARFLPCSSICMEMIEEEKRIQSYKHCSSFMKSNLRPSDFKLCLVCLLQSTFHAPANCFLTQRTVWQAQNILESLCFIYFSAACPSPTSLCALRCDLSTLSSSSTRSSCSGVHPKLWRTLKAHYPPLLLLRNTVVLLKWCIFHVCIQAPMHLYVLSHAPYVSPLKHVRT